MEKEQKICFGFLGNGITAWSTRFDSEGNLKDPDYEAHISPTREITYHQENTPKWFKDAVEKQAEDNAIVGNEQNYFAFYPKNKPTKYCDTRFYGRVLLCEEMCDGERHLFTTSGQIIDKWKNVKDIESVEGQKVFIVGNLKRNVHGNLLGAKFGFSLSKDVAEDAAAQIRNWESDCWRNAVVEECTHEELVGASAYYSLVNLDWEG